MYISTLNIILVCAIILLLNFVGTDQDIPDDKINCYSFVVVVFFSRSGQH